jgi:nucleotide-binding universal stress UspA family protein
MVAMDAVLVPLDEADYEERSRSFSERALEQVKIAADAAGVKCETVPEVHDQPYRAIVDAAQALNCDLIVMASHGRRGISALLLGSETAKVLTHSTVPVLVYR